MKTTDEYGQKLVELIERSAMIDRLVVKSRLKPLVKTSLPMSMQGIFVCSQNRVTVCFAIHCVTGLM